MRAVVQRTDEASVTVDGKVIAEVSLGLTVLLGVGREDTELDVQYLADKIVNLRIFPDEYGKMNKSLLDIRGELLIISQFTLFGDCRKGRRPGFDLAATPQTAAALYEQLIIKCREYDITVAHGQFQAEMIVKLSNHGPVTMLIDTKRLF